MIRCQFRAESVAPGYLAAVSLYHLAALQCYHCHKHQQELFHFVASFDGHLH